MTELEETKVKLEWSINLFSSFCDLVEGDLGREKVLYFLFMAEAKAYEREMKSKNNESYAEERS